MRKAIVTGGSGYFGGLLCKQLVDKGWFVNNIDINPPIHSLDNYEYTKGDIRDITKIVFY